MSGEDAGLDSFMEDHISGGYSLMGDDMSEFNDDQTERDAQAALDDDEFAHQEIEHEDHFRDDVEADADALASAGYGTDEDYGGGGDEWANTW